MVAEKVHLRISRLFGKQFKIILSIFYLILRAKFKRPIRLFPTLISKIKLLGSEQPLNRIKDATVIKIFTKSGI